MAKSKLGKVLESARRDENRKIRRFVGRLVDDSVRAGGPADCRLPPVTARMFNVFHRIDEAMIGTPDYAGIAYWWDHEYKHPLRACTAKQRKKAHDAILAAGLPLDGVSDNHKMIIERAAKRKVRA